MKLKRNYNYRPTENLNLKRLTLWVELHENSARQFRKGDHQDIICLFVCFVLLFFSFYVCQGTQGQNNKQNTNRLSGLVPSYRGSGRGLARIDPIMQTSIRLGPVSISLCSFLTNTWTKSFHFLLFSGVYRNKDTIFSPIALALSLVVKVCYDCVTNNHSCFSWVPHSP